MRSLMQVSLTHTLGTLLPLVANGPGALAEMAKRPLQGTFGLYGSKPLQTAGVRPGTNGIIVIWGPFADESRSAALISSRLHERCDGMALGVDRKRAWWECGDVSQLSRWCALDLRLFCLPWSSPSKLYPAVRMRIRRI